NSHYLETGPFQHLVVEPSGRKQEFKRTQNPSFGGGLAHTCPDIKQSLSSLHVNTAKILC
ncbi:16865_t:CDS:1, partial [Funneliformis geosporum]